MPELVPPMPLLVNSWELGVFVGGGWVGVVWAGRGNLGWAGRGNRNAQRCLPVAQQRWAPPSHPPPTLPPRRAHGWGKVALMSWKKRLA